jgi:sugar phosphate isomerase/epimerase
MSISRSGSRRDFLRVTGAALMACGSLVREAEAASKIEIIGFIKPIQDLPFPDISRVAREIGWSGIECPVRRGGTINPEKAEEKLPLLLQELKRQKLGLPIIATDVEDANDPLTRKVLKTASALGIRKYRIKHLTYDLNKSIPQQIKTFKAKLVDLVELNKELNIQATIQNHSGQNYLGAPVWDLWELIHDLDPKFIAAYFDIGHATVEGGLSWPLETKLMEPLLSVISVKDFTWKKSAKGDEGYTPEWCPLGQGMISPGFFRTIKDKFNGLIVQHFEYEPRKAEQWPEAMKKDREVLEQWLS